MRDSVEEVGALYVTMTPLEQHLFSLAEMVVDMLDESSTNLERVRLLVRKAIEPERLRAIKETQP